MTISTRNLHEFPTPDVLRALSKSLAVLDLILEPEWELRYYSYNSDWDVTEEMASMRDGSGSFYFILFNSCGAVLKGYGRDSIFGEYYRENGNSWPGVLDCVPDKFHTIISEPAFSEGEATFCCWSALEDSSWNIGDVVFPPDCSDPDGSESLLFVLDNDPITYKLWAESYHEVPVDEGVVRQIYGHEKLTESMVRTLNPNIRIQDIIDDLVEIKFPFGLTSA